MRTNKTCILLYVFGEEYQDYIPLFLYSLNKTYPDYYAKIICDKKVNIKILNLVNKIGNDKYIIVQEFEFDALTTQAKKNPNISKAIRWLYYDKELLEFDYIYIGDVDIFLTKEDKELHTQHIEHSNFISLPFSNFLRVKEVKKCSIISLIKNIKKYGFMSTAKFYLFFPEKVYRLSGLHFIKVKEYYDKVIPVIPKIIEELNKVVENKSSMFSLITLNNENILYMLLNEAGIEMDILKNNKNRPVFDPNINLNFNFRPHHGLHIGIWRSMKLAQKYPDVILSDIYIRYFLYFKELYDRDPLLKSIVNNMTTNTTNYLLNMLDYYNLKNIERAL
jgi:hypothetical protein